MSFYTGTQSEVLFSGPPASYTAGGGSSTSAFNLTVGSTGNYQQPLFPGGFWQQGRTGQLATIEGSIIVTGQGSATTLTLVLQLDTAANTTGGSTLLTYPAVTITSYSAGVIYFYAFVQNRGSGYGTSSVATNLYTTGWWMGSGNSLVTQNAAGPTQLATTDFSVNQWITLQGTMSTSSGTNSAQLASIIVRGEN